MKAFDFLIKILSSCLFVGYLPLIPGTFGTIFGLVLYYFVRNSPSSQIILLVLVILVGFLVSGKAERLLKRKDPSQIVIDEVAGILITFLFIPYSFKITIVGFFVFRLLDAIKPFPASSSQRFKGSLGVMSDDIIAAIYTNLVLQAILKLISFKLS